MIPITSNESQFVISRQNYLYIEGSSDPAKGNFKHFLFSVMSLKGQLVLSILLMKDSLKGTLASICFLKGKYTINVVEKI